MFGLYFQLGLYNVRKQDGAAQPGQQSWSSEELNSSETGQKSAQNKETQESVKRHKLTWPNNPVTLGELQGFLALSRSDVQPRAGGLTAEKLTF